MQCNATTKKNKRCLKQAMEGSSFCWIHSFGRVKNIPIYKNATFQFVFTVILALGILIYQTNTGPSFENQQKGLSNDEKILEELNLIKKTIAKSNSIELPGKSVIIMARFYSNPSDSSRYIFDCGNPKEINSSRLSAYISPKNELIFKLSDNCNNELYLDINEGFETFYFSERYFWFFEYGISDTLSYIRVYCNAKIIGEKSIRKKLCIGLNDLSFYTTIGASLVGKNLGKFDAWMYVITKANSIFTKDDKRILINSTYSSLGPLLSNPLPPEWAQYRGNFYMISDPQKSTDQLIRITTN